MIKNILNKKYNLLRPIKTQELVRLGKNMVGGYVVDLSMIEKTNILIILFIFSHLYLINNNHNININSKLNQIM